MHLRIWTPPSLPHFWGVSRPPTLTPCYNVTFRLPPYPPPSPCHHVIARHLLADPPPPPQVITSFMNSPLTGTSCSSGRPSRGGQPGEAGGGEKKVEVDWTNGDGDECRGWWTGPRFYVAGWQPSSRHQQIDCVHQIRLQRLPDVDNIVVPVLQSKLQSSFSSTTVLVLLTRNENTWTSAVGDLVRWPI